MPKSKKKAAISGQLEWRLPFLVINCAVSPLCFVVLFDPLRDRPLERRRHLLPQIFQTGGSSSGYNSQAFQPSIWHSILGVASQVGTAAL